MHAVSGTVHLRLLAVCAIQTCPQPTSSSASWNQILWRGLNLLGVALHLLVLAAAAAALLLSHHLTMRKAATATR